MVRTTCPAMNCTRSLLLARVLAALAPRSPAPRSPSALHTASAGLFRSKHASLGQRATRLPSRCFHSSARRPDAKPAPSSERSDQEGESSHTGAGKTLVTYEDLFERAARDSRTKATFTRVLEVFCKEDVRRRGHVEFIYAALKKMPEFGVEGDLSVYNKLLDVFPKEVFVPRNYIQRMFNHYPRQQECGVQLLEHMENYGVMPNVETKVLLVQIFGEKGHPMRKYQRLMYWFPRFKHVNPYPVPRELPRDPVDLARLSLQRIAGDLDARVTVYEMPSTDLSECGEDSSRLYVVGIQSPDQQTLLSKHNPERPVFVEGPFPLWLRKTCVYYYTLRADPLPPEEKVEEPVDPERSFFYPLELDLDLDRDLGDDDDFDVDEVEEGPVFALCMASSGDQATLSKWISGLQETNPILGRTPTVFRLNSGPQEIQTSSEPERKEDQDLLQSRKMTQ
ncbi:evolutionarily conserved signaling intermediate in Toll pathway, mitochondrial isoform X1 [Acipenser ruthenus]|uniref:evolutionarily conserved signaling intermediate in Toll pathway, mitochondrial isoform X1 n=2 Tax=Acipenser ruthenus TaxID=7906 RepID=UPI002740A23A|nr:evolutionarily conserved signaling intermediate in Toll pathway, mitochondrial isoform X1 [Acipenser ruthenus]